MNEYSEKTPEPTSTGPLKTTSLQGPPDGFGKDVNDYLNHYIPVTDTKAGILLASILIITPLFLLPTATCTTVLFLQIAALLLIVGSAITGTIVIFPRLPHGKQGLIFWEDIRIHKSPESYFFNLHNLDRRGAEQEWAKQNYYVSQVLHNKQLLLRWSIALLLLAAVLFLISLITSKICQTGTEITTALL